MSSGPVHSASSAYESLIARVREATLLASTASILEWDQEVMMPRAGAGLRSEQLAQIARLRHEIATHPAIADLLQSCELDDELTADPRSVAAVNLRVIRREYDRLIKLPPDLVEEIARVRTLAHGAWIDARAARNFKLFAPALERMIRLLREKAECLGGEQHSEPWDALADECEPGMKVAGLSRIFAPLRKELVALIQELDDSPRNPANPFWSLPLSIDKQAKFVRHLVEQIGFDFARGRLDPSVHPFCLGWHRRDVRLTTRLERAKLLQAIGSTMHELGHAIYDQHHPEEHFGTPMGRAVSTAMHEGQARMWENMIGRSGSFWTWCFPKLREFFGKAVTHLTFDQVLAAANVARPGLIRVEAGEATYNLHIFIRFDLERALISGDLAVADLPGAWNERYHSDLGLEVPNDAVGCLQDIHWAEGLVGYFPTYALGNMYAAQIFERIRIDLPALESDIARGDFSAIIAWLDKHIYSQGMRDSAPQLCERITGRPLSHKPLMNYLTDKLRAMYGV